MRKQAEGRHGCIGHLLEQAQPDAYDSRYARWNLADLPIVRKNGSFVLVLPAKQLNVIKRHTQAGEIIHAGDPDREGQLLVDEVLDYLQLPAESASGSAALSDKRP